MRGASKVVDDLASWASEMMPDGYDVTASDAGVTISSGPPSFYHATIFVALTLREIEPPERSLELALQVFAIGFQNNMTRIMGEVWPEADAEPHYSVTSDELHVWWGGKAEQNASVRMPPIPRPDKHADA